MIDLTPLQTPLQPGLSVRPGRAACQPTAPTLPTTTVKAPSAPRHNGFPYGAGLAFYAASTVRRIGIIGDGGNEMVDEFSLGRVEDTLQAASPRQDSTVPANCQPSAMVTSCYVDSKIAIPVPRRGKQL